MENNMSPNSSEHINELATALAKAQGEIESAPKDSKNPFFKSKYASLESVWNTCKSSLSKNGLCVMQYLEVIEGKYSLVTRLAHSSGQWIKSEIPLFMSKQDAQGLGSAMTYARRYGLSALVGIVSDEDDDAESITDHSKQTFFSDSQVRSFREELNKTNLSWRNAFVQEIKNTYGNGPESIPASKFGEYMGRIKQNIEITKKISLEESNVSDRLPTA